MNPKITVALAPMEGVVDPIIREVFSLIGGYDLMFTEFIRVTQNLNPDKVFYKFCPELKNGGKTFYGTPVTVQLLGSDHSAMVDNAAKALELGSHGIDINFGCPAKTVNRHDGGAALLKDPQRVGRLLEELLRQLPCSSGVSAKIRLGFEDTKLLPDLAQILKSLPLKHLTVHARTKLQGYKPPAHWIEIKNYFSGFSYPVFANGDIWSFEDWKKCFQVTECAHFALGRGAFANPALGQQIKLNNPRALSWNEFTESLLPLFYQKSHEYRDHHYALCRLKQWLKFLGRNYTEADVAFSKIKTLKSFAPPADFWNTL